MSVKQNDGNFLWKIFQTESLDNAPDEAQNNLISSFILKLQVYVF